MALTKACQRDDVNLEEIGDLVRTDAALSGRLLALANSAASGGRTLVSADEAISRMGLATVSKVALAFSLIDQHSDGHCRNFDYAGFWNQSLLMASASSQLGSSLRLGASGELFTVGLLSRVGMLALATAFPKDYSDIVVAEPRPIERLLIEERKIGINHQTLSIALMEHWGIQPEYSKPFGSYELESLNAATSNAQINERALLSRASFLIAQALTGQGADTLTDDAECIAPLSKLGLNRAQLLERISEIETVWQVWLALLARQI